MLSLLARGVLILTLAWVAPRAGAQTPTQFTYQGQLNLQGQLYAGTADYTFTLWDSLVGGDPIGTALAVPGVTVSGGLFTVPLDFGSDTFSQPRFLEIAVRTPAWNGQGQPPAFTTLDPRQAITASPYSIATRGIFVGSDPQRVGIGTTAPFAGPLTTYPLEWKGLHVASTNPGAKAVGLFEGFDWSRIHLRNASAAVPANTRNFVIDNTDGLAFFRWLNDDLGVRSQPLTFAPSGNVGVGTTGTPTARLHIGGTPGVDGLRFPDGTLQTTASTLSSGEPNLLLVRGRYDEAGVVTGTGFTVSRLSAGVYRVTFTRPWASPATVVVSPSGGPGFGATCLPTASVSAWNVTTYVTGLGTLTDVPFTLIAVGVPQ